MATGFCYGCNSGIILSPETLLCPLCSSDFVELAEAEAEPARPSLSGLLARILSHDGDYAPVYAPAPAPPRAEQPDVLPITNLAQYLSESFSPNQLQPDHARYPAHNPYAEGHHPPPAPPSDLPRPAERMYLDQQQNEIPGVSPLSFLYTLFFGRNDARPGAPNPGDYAWGPNGFDRILNELIVQAQGHPGPNACSDPTIAALPRIVMTQPMLEKSSVADCSICREEFAVAETLIKLPCPHYFHGDCIEPWLKSSGTCPVCRFAIVPQPGDEPAPIAEVRSRTPSASMSRSSSSLPGSFPGGAHDDVLEEELD